MRGCTQYPLAAENVVTSQSRTANAAGLGRSLPTLCWAARTRGRCLRPGHRVWRCVRCPCAGCWEQRGAPLRLADRVPDDLVIVHRGAAAGRGAVGGLAERAPGESLRFA